MCSKNKSILSNVSQNNECPTSFNTSVKNVKFTVATHEIVFSRENLMIPLYYLEKFLSF